MIEVGRLCLKTAGREAGKVCVIVELLDKNYVLIDGEVRRKKCNIFHLEPLDKSIDIKSKATHSEVVEKFKKMNIEIKERKAKQKKEKPKKKRKGKKAEEEQNLKKGKKPKKEKVKKKEDANLDRKV